MFSTTALPNSPHIVTVRMHSITFVDSWHTQTLQQLIQTEQDCKLDIHLHNRNLKSPKLYIIKVTGKFILWIHPCLCLHLLKECVKISATDVGKKSHLPKQGEKLKRNDWTIINSISRRRPVIEGHCWESLHLKHLGQGWSIFFIRGLF